MLQQFNAEEMVDSIAHATTPPLLKGDFAAAALTAQALAEDLHLSLSDTSRVACGPGCDSCCVVNVAVLPPESEAIVGYLQQNLSVSSLGSLHKKLMTLHDSTHGLSEEERIMANQCCAFLDSNGNCSVYPVRPLLCRSVNSTDAEDCRTAMSMVAQGKHHPIISCLVQKEIFEAAFIGLAKALKTCGLDDRSFRLAGSILLRLNEDNDFIET